MASDKINIAFSIPKKPLYWIGGILGTLLAIFLLWHGIRFFFGWDIYVSANDPVTAQEAQVVCNMLEEKNIDAQFCYNPDKTEIWGVLVRRPQMGKAKRLDLSLDTAIWEFTN